MQKKVSTKGGTKKRKGSRKLLDLPEKTVKSGGPGSIKGGTGAILYQRTKS